MHRPNRSDLIAALLLASFCSVFAQQSPPAAAAAQEPVITRQPTPQYPPAAAAGRISGLVRVHVFVSATGDVAQVKLMSGHPLFADAAKNAAAAMKFAPRSVDGTPQPFSALISYYFELNSHGRASIRQKVSYCASATEPECEEVITAPVRAIDAAPNGDSVKLLPISIVTPALPPEARAQRVEGQVMLSVTISPEGRVTDVTVESGHPLLTKAAVEAMQLWRFAPFIRGGKPVAVHTHIPINFSLNGR